MIALLKEIEDSRGVPVEWLCAALEEALQQAYRQQAGDADVLVHIDRTTGEQTLHRRRRIVDGVADPQRELARDVAPAGYLAGDYLDERVDVGDFGRLAALTAKRVIAQRVIEWERERVWARYRPLQGTIVTGLVQREIHGSIYVVFEDGNEAVLPRSERSPNDRFFINDELEAELLTVAKTARGPALILSRSRGSFVRAMLGPHAGILATARRPGFVTVLATVRPIDTLAIARELGERVDVVEWSDDAAVLASRVFPAGVEAFALEDERIIIVESPTVSALQIDIAAQLTGWPVLSAEPGRSDVALETHRAAIAAAAQPTEHFNIDPAIVRALEEFAREREASEDV